jgi:cytochrome c-type biogenesis protein CcmF
MTGAISAEKRLRMAPGDAFELGGYQFTFEGTRSFQGPNFVADEGRFTVTRDGEAVAVLKPQKRRYVQGGQVMTEAAIDPGLTRDLYVSLGEALDDRGVAWSVALYYKPFVRWIWLGAIFMAAGGFLAASDRRYRRPAAVTETTAAAQATA